jgi:hypothetical protein
MTAITFKLYGGALVAAALMSAPLAIAAPSEGTTGVREALAAARQGPDQLRWFIQRTKAIYELDYMDIMALAEAQKIVSTERPTKVAQLDKR